MGIALCKSGLKNHFARHAQKKESDGFGASAQQAHTIARATQTTTKKHIEQEKNIYISIQSIDIQRNKKERNVRHEWCQLTVQGLYVNIYLYK